MQSTKINQHNCYHFLPEIHLKNCACEHEACSGWNRIKRGFAKPGQLHMWNGRKRGRGELGLHELCLTQFTHWHSTPQRCETGSAQVSKCPCERGSRFAKLSLPLHASKISQGGPTSHTSLVTDSHYFYSVPTFYPYILSMVGPKENLRLGERFDRKPKSDRQYLV